ncbi:MAG: sugar ABC transporter ATP-binding protein [Lysobacterales bacterium]|nr:MAG: sugar ABC transporter ATP-binding protein [Xanthomonadales bacterium]
MADEILVEVRNLSKHFPGVRALDGVSFAIRKNTVHCIVGENGSGKSTFIKTLTGAHPKTAGEVLLGGRPFEPRSIGAALASGISVLYQELNVVDDLTVQENLTLGKEQSLLGFITRPRGLEEVKEILQSLDPSIRLGDMVGNLSVAQKQVIEIAKAVSANCSLLIMDEPTASLSEQEVDRLFAIIRKLKERGITVIYISHKLAEVFEIGDVVTVFRDGQVVDTLEVGSISKACRDVGEACLQIVRLMLGKVVAETYIPRPSTGPPHTLMEARNLTNAKLRGVSFSLAAGEILGFYGLVGSGKTEVARVLYGLDAYEGEILVNGTKRELRDVRSAMGAGLAMVPEERRADGIFGILSVRENVPMMRIRSILTYGLLSRQKENALADRYIASMSIAARDREQKVGLLSGGNQQKVVISKCLNREAEILLMDEPTRGVDVGAKLEIHEIIRNLASEGRGIIVFTSEMPEVLHLCDRIVLMHEGQMGEIVVNGSPAASRDHIMSVVAGGR